MGCIQSTAADETPKEPSLAKPGKLTSDFYNDKNPPIHWSDTVFLAPHEFLRSEMIGLEKGTKALPDSTTEDDAWKAEFFGTWVYDVFIPGFHLHHKSEEEIYLPFMKEKGCKVPEEKIAKDHQALMKDMDEIQNIAKAMAEKKGLDCAEEIKSLKAKIPTFCKEMREHLKEEEVTLTLEIKANIKKEENDEAVGRIIQEAGVKGLEEEIPAVMVASKEWMTDEFYLEFEKEIPPPILKITKEIFIPNYLTYYRPMRDAPTMSENPNPEKKIPFNPSMLPPPPEAAAS